MNDHFASEPGPTIDELVRIARDAGESDATRRTIHHWVSKELVGRPRQIARRWRYPNAAIGQVDTIARLRHEGIHPDFHRFALFVEVGGRPYAEARAFLLEYLGLWRTAVADHHERLAADPEALRAEAATAARKRGRSAPLPRVVRMTLDERTLATLYTLGGLFAGQLTPDEEEQGQKAVERLVGLRSGRGGAERDLTEISVSARDWPTDADALVDAVQTASEARLEIARRGVALAVVWLPALRSLFLEMFTPAAGAPLLDAIEQWQRMLAPEMYALLISILVKNLGERATDAQVEELLPTFNPELYAALALSEQPEDVRRTALRRLRPYQRLQLEREMAALLAEHSQTAR